MNKRSQIGLKTALAAVVGYFVYEWLSPLTESQRYVASIFSATVILWGVNAAAAWIPAAAAPALLVATGVIPFAAFAGILVDETILLFIGSFVIARGIIVTKLDQRFAFYILSIHGFVSTPGRLIASFGGICCVLSLFVSNTAVAAMMLPVCLEMIKFVKAEKDRRFDLTMLLMLTWGSSVAVGFLVGTPPNMLGQSFIAKTTGVRIGFVDWMIFAMPINLLLFGSALLVLRALFGASRVNSSDSVALARARLSDLGALTAGERHVCAVLAFTILLWTMPELILAVAADHPLARLFARFVTPAHVSLLGAVALLALPARNRPHGRTLHPFEAARINWGTIVLFGGGLVLGRAVFSSGLAEVVGGHLGAVAGGHGLFVLTAGMIFATILMSELASNTTSAALMVPLAISIATSSGLNPIPPALGAALGASMGFMMPISTPPNSIVYSSGLIPSSVMMKAGLLMDIIGFFAILFGLRLVLPMMGLW